MQRRTTGSSESLGEYLRETAILAVGDPSPVGQNKDWGSLLSVTGETSPPFLRRVAATRPRGLPAYDAVGHGLCTDFQVSGVRQ